MALLGVFCTTPRKGKIRLAAVGSICCKPKLTADIERMLAAQSLRDLWMKSQGYA